MMILNLLTPGERRRGMWVLVVAILAAFLEMAGIAAVMPFLAAVGDPAAIQSNQYLRALHTWLDAPPRQTFLMQLGVASFTAVAFSAIFRMCANYLLNRFVEMERHSLGVRLLEKYLRQPYEFFIQGNSADLSRTILSEVDVVIQNGFRPFVNLVAYICVVVAMLGFLISVDLYLAVGAGLIIGGSYLLVFSVVRRLLLRIGEARVAANQQRFHAAAAAFSAIKDVKLLGTEPQCLTRFAPPSLQNAAQLALNTTLTQLPKYFIEAIGVGGIILMAIVLLQQTGGQDSDMAGLGTILPVLGLYGLAGIRLLPAAQNIYTAVANLRFSAPAVAALLSDLQRPHETPAGPVLSPLRVQRAIRMEQVHYSYPGSTREALRGIDITVPVGARVGIIGTTGSGKTTLIDILLALLPPSSGRIVIDGTALTPDLIPAWQAGLGYVRQDIVLTDTTVAANIAFGVPPSAIDRDLVRACARVAQIDEMIMDQMPQGYDTLVGERGIRLSGGQRQRIGIARALYRKPGLIILDEATSALDGATETAVMQAIRAMGQDVTIIMIAHRLSSLEGCDQVIALEQGQIVAQGTLDDVLDARKDLTAAPGPDVPARAIAS
jgi:ATP-binding cassette, subfamily B, bacterial PglK